MCLFLGRFRYSICRIDFDHALGNSKIENLARQGQDSISRYRRTTLSYIVHNRYHILTFDVPYFAVSPGRTKVPSQHLFIFMGGGGFLVACRVFCQIPVCERVEVVRVSSALLFKGRIYSTLNQCEIGFSRGSGGRNAQNRVCAQGQSSQMSAMAVHQNPSPSSTLAYAESEGGCFMIPIFDLTLYRWLHTFHESIRQLYAHIFKPL